MADDFSKIPGLGKYIGAIFGYFIAGPIGAFIGLFIGNFFDKSLKNETIPELHHPTTRPIFIKALFSAMGYLAKSDGRVTETSIASAKELMAKLHLKKHEMTEAQDFFRQGKEFTNHHIEDLIIPLRMTLELKPHLLQIYVSFLYQFAKKDGLTAKKIERLNQIFKIIGFAPLHQQNSFYENAYQYSSQQQYHHQSSSKNNIEQAYVLLGLKPDASAEEAKRQYRRLISKNHPDKLIAKGASQLEIKRANEKTQAISRAYDTLCQYKGW